MPIPPIQISAEAVANVNDYLADGASKLLSGFNEVIHKYGGPDEINKRAAEVSTLDYQLMRLQETKSPHREALTWLQQQVKAKAFVTMADYIAVHGGASLVERQPFAVTLEISALQYFPWIIREAEQAITNRELMPGRFVQVRNMAEQEADGDLMAILAATNIIGASLVETLDTKGTDGSNVHLGGPSTITGYFGGVGQPNEHALQWLDEYLRYLTTYGVRQVLNINQGTILLGYLLRNIGVQNEFKISVFMGNDNPYSVLATLILAKLFERPGCGTPLIGFNLSNSVTNRTIELIAEPRAAFGFEDVVRFEHHITEAYKSIVRQPYLRRDELVDVATRVRNISAKHEGGEPNTEAVATHPSDILDYFMTKAQVAEANLDQALLDNYLGKHHSLNLTAGALVSAGIPVIAAKLHD